jgi:hypothetical protein
MKSFINHIAPKIPCKSQLFLRDRKKKKKKDALSSLMSCPPLSYLTHRSPHPSWPQSPITTTTERFARCRTAAPARTSAWRVSEALNQEVIQDDADGGHRFSCWNSYYANWYFDPTTAVFRLYLKSSSLTPASDIGPPLGPCIPSRPFRLPRQPTTT